MRSEVDNRFQKNFRKLPLIVQKRVKKSLELWKQDPYYQGLQFKKISRIQPIWSLRIGRHYRVLGLKEKNTLKWFWVGTHSNYDKLISQLN